jgi:hypothetical protein
LPGHFADHRARRSLDIENQSRANGELTDSSRAIVFRWEHADMRILIIMLVLVEVGCSKAPPLQLDAPLTLTLDCPSYCNLIQTNCTGANAQYPDLGHCLGSCASFAPGALGDMSGNTLGCRIYHAGVPSMTTPATHCVHAGPGGVQTNAAAPQCGDACTSFCNLERKICGSSDAPLANITPQYQNATACMTACARFDKTHLYSVTPASAGDSLACRLYHATNAASFAVLTPPDTAQVNTHCGHTGVAGGTSAATCMAGTAATP